MEACRGLHAKGQGPVLTASFSHSGHTWGDWQSQRAGWRCGGRKPGGGLWTGQARWWVALGWAPGAGPGYSMAVRVRLLPPTLNVFPALASQQTGSSPGFLTAEKCSGWEDASRRAQEGNRTKERSALGQALAHRGQEAEESLRHSRALWRTDRAWVPRTLSLPALALGQGLGFCPLSDHLGLPEISRVGTPIPPKPQPHLPSQCPHVTSAPCPACSRCPTPPHTSCMATIPFCIWKQSFHILSFQHSRSSWLPRGPEPVCHLDQSLAWRPHPLQPHVSRHSAHSRDSCPLWTGEASQHRWTPKA